MAASSYAVLGAAPAAAAGPCGPPVVNPVACENTLPGDPASDWQPGVPDDPSIVGFATSMSVNVGQTESFKIKTDSTAYHIDILRLGWYGGDGARKVAANIAPTAHLPQTQPGCNVDPSTGEVDCGNWSVSASWTVPSTAVSGVYIAHLVREDTGASSQIEFVVRNDTSHSDLLVQTSDATWQAYNAYGGNSLYWCNVSCPPGNPGGYKGAFAVSYNRPFVVPAGDPYGQQEQQIWWSEYSMIRFLEENGYDISYTSESDVDRNGALLQNHKVFVSSGHDEYWSAGQRTAVQNALNAGVNLAFFSGNEMFWKTRWGPSIDGSNTPYRTLITYKETHFDSPVDPQDPPTWTGTWRDPRFSPPGDGGNPENALTGQLGMVDFGTTDIQVPSQYSKLRFWRNTDAATLSPGSTLTLDPDGQTLGFEWDVDADNGFRPAGEFDLSSTTVDNTNALLNDYGTTEATGKTVTHHLSLYRAASGALVFGAGTIQWSWGLDSQNPSGNPPDPNMQQATVNLLADMGAQPATLESGLAAATKSADTTPPHSSITNPTSGALVGDGSVVGVTGTATDSGGGVVAGVEVSADGGTTWHPATLTSPAGTSVTWSYSWIAHGTPSTTLLSRATDDSGNIETPGAGINVNVSCPCSIWGKSVTPGQIDVNDGSNVELGVKFTSDTNASILGVRFYKSVENIGTHTGSLWDSNGNLLAQGSFTNETASGWQTLMFSSPVSITVGQTYVASYHAPTGHYSSTQGYFYPPPSPPGIGGGTVDSGPLHALRDIQSTTNGVFAYSNTPAFPTDDSNATNFWIDPIYGSVQPLTAPGQVTNVTATAGFQSATVSWSPPSTGGAPSSYTITPYIGSTAQPTTTVSGMTTSTQVTGLTQGIMYTFTVQASNSVGSGPVSAQSNAVTPAAASTPSPPLNVTAGPATGQALVSWTAPANNGGSSITSYTITPYAGSTAQTAVQVSGASATSAIITGLTNGTAYTFTVKATNAIGTGPESGASSATTPQNTILDFSAPIAANVDSNDPGSAELGVKFTADTNGSITGLRFYKAAANTGTHIGTLWTTGGTLLAQATFTNETASGWQTVQFSSPVNITAGTTYVAADFDPNGHYSGSKLAFASAVNNPPLHAVADSTSSNGVYAYTPTSTFPTSSYQASNYWIDVLFQPPAPPAKPGQVTGAAATTGLQSATVSWTPPSSGGPVSTYTVTPYAAGGEGSTAQSPTTVSGSITSTTLTGLTAGTSYTFTVQASNASGAGLASTPSNAITPTAGSVPSAPTAVSASPATGQALVNWSAPASNGGSQVTGYTITPYIGATAQTPTQVSGASTTSAIIAGLTNGAAYTFTVKAANANGTSPESSASAAVTPQDTILDFSAPSGGSLDSGDSLSAELGVKFTADSSGQILGIRFYKSAANTGTHIGSLWTAGGALLAQATFVNETASGWQTVQFASPVNITAGTTYVAAYFDPNGHYSGTKQAFTSPVDNPPLHTVADGTSSNGLYAYTGVSSFPTNSFQASNYWVDVLYQPPTPPAKPGQPTNASATAGFQSATVTWTPPSTGGAPTSYTVTPFIGSNAQTPTNVSGSTTSTTITGLTQGTTYTFTVTASNAAGSGPASSASNPVTPTGGSVPSAPLNVIASPASAQALVSWTAPANNGGNQITGYTITPYIGSSAQPTTQVNNGSATSATVTGLTNGSNYTFTVKATNGVGTGNESTASSAIAPQNTIFDFTAPAAGNIDSGDPGSAEVGVKFTADTSGQITGIRFYKSAANTGTHIGSLWTAAGALLAQATFTGETASGWQTVLFSSPVAVTAGTTYVAAYFDPNGHYSGTKQAFTTAVDNPPLHGVANATSANGLYAYSATSTFPTNSFQASSYWVDVLFAPTSLTAPGQPTSVSAIAGFQSATVSWTPPSTGGAPSSYTVTPFIGSNAQTPTSVSGSTTSTPITGLTQGTAYTFTVQASNSVGSGPASAPSNAVTPTGPTAPSAPTGVTASPATNQALISWTAPGSSGGSPITGYTITPYIGSTAQATTQVSDPSATSAIVTGLTNGTAYTFTVKAKNVVGAGSESTPSAQIKPQNTIFDFSAPAPGNVDSGDSGSAELGVKFTADTNGSIVGIRFYKAQANTGTHIGSLWTAAGALLAQATFTGETASGWQTVLFSSPVAITAGTTYVAAYFDPNGHYSGTKQAFVSAVNNAPLHAVSNSIAPNGVYNYSPFSTFPNSSFQASNYWVDVLFAGS
jgi:hypothetical protein